MPRLTAVLSIFLVALGTPAASQHLDERLQWQPITMPPDLRLQQQVAIEILGRAVAPALEMLSEATGVSLSVATEDLDTLGERKVTIIANDVTLEALMLQLPEALRECQWDADHSGGEPTYLLHRNAGANLTADWLVEREGARRAAQRRAERTHRMEEAARALIMSPQELQELEREDPLLALSVQDPHSRDLLEILLSLPPEQAEQFREKGHLELAYSQASERMRSAVHRIAEMRLHPGLGAEWNVDVPEAIQRWRDDPYHSFLSVEDWRVDRGFGIRLCLNIPTLEGILRGHNSGVQDVALFPRYCSLDDGESLFARLLLATGVADRETAFEMAGNRERQGFRAGDAVRAKRREREWTEPTDPALLQTIVIGDRQFADIAGLQSLIAADTGLSVVSDYFTRRGPHLPEDVREGIPLWRLLYLIGEDGFRNEDVHLWRKAGSLLVFHRADWAILARAEIPEWLIADYRARLNEQGELTLDDLAELAVVLDARSLPVESFPMDLRRAGAYTARQESRWALVLYGSLTPDQKAAVASPQGLGFFDMSLSQRWQVLDRAARRPVPLPREQAYGATFGVAHASTEAHSRRLLTTTLELRFPAVTDEVMVAVRVLDRALEE